MAYPKRLRPANYSNQDRAIEAHSGFVSYVVGKVQKVGIEKVLQASRINLNSKGSEKNWYWLKQAYEKVLEFAEQVQLKQIPQKLEGSGEDGEFLVKVVIDDGNQATQESGNRIGEYFEV